MSGLMQSYQGFQLPVRDREGYIAALRAHIAANHNVTNATRALNYILSIPEPVVPPDLASLPKQVSNRILVLRRILDSEEGREPGNFKNIQALIEGYTNGTLTIDTDDQSVSGVGRLWMETVGIDQLPVLFGLPDVDLLKYWMMQPFAFHQMAARAAFPPTNQSQHHEYYVSLRKLGGQYAVDLLVLDNTGSNYMTLYDNDLLQLDVDLTYDHWGGTVTLSTANGNVNRTVVRMEITIKDQQRGSYGPVDTGMVCCLPWAILWECTMLGYVSEGESVHWYRA
ncbi:hypothetical protein BGX38DRAFT_1267006 [Terfezia claveryi]|nr:hypothetical protein BGX38DRAFT_1267006 [Terfezia claveryi]